MAQWDGGHHGQARPIHAPIDPSAHADGMGEIPGPLVLGPEQLLVVKWLNVTVLVALEVEDDVFGVLVELEVADVLGVELEVEDDVCCCC